MVSCTSLLGMSRFGLNARGWWGLEERPTLPIGLQKDSCFAWLVVACGLAGNGVQGTI